MLRILLADDHPGVPQIVRSLLESEFAVVGSVCDGRALIDTAAKLHPDMIITDISMPILNGLDAVRELKKSGLTAFIIFLTVHSDPDFVQACRAAGGDGHVSKDRMADDLLPAIHEVLEKAHH